MRLAARLSNAWPARLCRSAVSVLQAHVTKHPLRCSAMQAAWLSARVCSASSPCKPFLSCRLRTPLRLHGVPFGHAGRLPLAALTCRALLTGSSARHRALHGARVVTHLPPQPKHGGHSLTPSRGPSITLALTAAACRGVAGCGGPHRDTVLAIAAREHAGIVSPDRRTGGRRHTSTSGLVPGRACWTSILRRLCACETTRSHTCACAHGACVPRTGWPQHITGALLPGAGALRCSSAASAASSASSLTMTCMRAPGPPHAAVWERQRTPSGRACTWSRSARLPPACCAAPCSTVAWFPCCACARYSAAQARSLCGPHARSVG